MHSLAYTVKSKNVPSPDLKQLNALTTKYLKHFNATFAICY